MDSHEAFLQVFGDIRITDILIFILALGYIIPQLKKAILWLKGYLRQTDRQEAALGNAEKLGDYHQQSIDIRNKLQEQIEDLQKAINGIIERLDRRDELDRVRRMNKTRSQLIQMFQFYGSDEHNPQKAWTAMEADAFWKNFQDYEEDGGDGYVHTDVEPVMRSLKEIPMAEQEEIVRLMQSRR